MFFAATVPEDQLSTLRAIVNRHKGLVVDEPHLASVVVDRDEEIDSKPNTDPGTMHIHSLYFLRPEFF